MGPVNLFHGLIEPVSKDGLINKLTDSVVQETSVLMITSVSARESWPSSTRGSTMAAERDRILMIDNLMKGPNIYLPWIQQTCRGGMGLYRERGCSFSPFVRYLDPSC
jgi:hypothetical protein